MSKSTQISGDSGFEDMPLKLFDQLSPPTVKNLPGDRNSRSWGRRSRTTPRLPHHRGDEGLRLLHGLEANLATSLQTPQEA